MKSDPTQPERTWVSAEEASKALGLSRSEVYRRLNEGRLEGDKSTGRWIVALPRKSSEIDDRFRSSANGAVPVHRQSLTLIGTILQTIKRNLTLVILIGLATAVATAAGAYYTYRAYSNSSPDIKIGVANPELYWTRYVYDTCLKSDGEAWIKFEVYALINVSNVGGQPISLVWIELSDGIVVEELLRGWVEERTNNEDDLFTAVAYPKAIDAGHTVALDLYVHFQVFGSLEEMTRLLEDLRNREHTSWTFSFNDEQEASWQQEMILTPDSMYERPFDASC